MGVAMADSAVDRVDRVDADGDRRALPKRLWAVMVLQAALMMSMAFLYPTYQEPDEIAHTDYVTAYRHGDWIYGPGERHYQDGVLLSRDVPSTYFQSNIGKWPIKPRAQRRSFDERGTGYTEPSWPNQMVQHPPLYYATAALLSEAVPNFDKQHSDVQVFWLRMISLLLLLPVPVLIFLIGRRLTGDDTVGLVAALIPLSMPAYLRVGASVTNDSLAILFGTALLYALSRVITGDLTRRTAVFTGLLWAGALLTKGLALVLPPFIVLAYLVGASGALRERIRRAWLPAIVCGGVGAVVGGWWWVRNLIVYGTVQPLGLGPHYGARSVRYGPDRPGGTELGFLHQFVRLFSIRTWGSLGLIDSPAMPTWVPTIVLVAFLVLVVMGVAVGLRRTSAPRAAALTFAVPVALTLVPLSLKARGIYLHTLMVPGLQARYLMPVFAGLLVCATLGLRRYTGRFARWLPTAALVCVFLFQVAAALVYFMDELPSPYAPSIVDRVRSGLHVALGWSPWSRSVTVGLLSAAVLAAVAALVMFAAQAWRTPVAAYGGGSPLHESPESEPEPRPGADDSKVSLGDRE